MKISRITVYVVCSKPQFLSDIEAFNAFHSSACVLL